MKRGVISLAITALAGIASAQDILDPDALSRKISESASICEKYSGSTQLLCEINFNQLAIEPYYMKTPQAVALLKERLGEEEAEMNIRAHGQMEYEEIMHEYEQMLASYSK